MASRVAARRRARRGARRADGRHQPGCLLGRNQLDVESDAVSTADPALQLHPLLPAGGEAKAAHGLEDAELAIELDAVATESHHGRGWVELGDQAGRVAGGAAGEVGLLEENGVAPASPGQVISDAGPGDSAANHDGA